MMKEKHMRLVQISIYMLIWTLLLLIPILAHNRDGALNWNRVFSDWVRFLPFLLVFIIHHFGLLPLLIKRKKLNLYLTLTLITIFLISFLSPNLRFLNDLVHQISAPPLEPINPPFNLEGGRPPQRMPQGPEIEGSGFFKAMMFYNLVVSILLVGFDAAISLAAGWIKQEQKTKEVEKNQLQTELAFLRNQVSPHFFMNTLNNIHALIEEDQPKAQDAIIRLSNLMRYLLYETREGKVPLKQELEFLNSYFDLMRLRYDSKVKILLDLPKEIPSISLPPLLSISFIENAFKHGISYQTESFVDLKLELVEGYLEYRISNSIADSQSSEAPPSNSGIGQENVKRQLTMLYGDRFDLTIRKDQKTYFVFMKIPLDHD